MTLCKAFLTVRVLSPLIPVVIGAGHGGPLSSHSPIHPAAVLNHAAGNSSKGLSGVVKSDRQDEAAIVVDISRTNKENSSGSDRTKRFVSSVSTLLSGQVIIKCASLPSGSTWPFCL